MVKSELLSKTIAIVLLFLLTMGIGGYCAPRLVQALCGQPVNWHMDFSTSETPLSPFEEQALLQQAYEETLASDIVSAIEQVAGVGTVQATVRVQLNLARETVDQTYHKNQVAYVGQHRVVGLVDKLSVSVLIDGQTVTAPGHHAIYQPRTKAEMAHYKTMIKAIIGFDAERGDQLEVVNIPFLKAPNRCLGLSGEQWVQLMVMVLLAALAGVFIFRFIFPFLAGVVRSDSGIGKGMTDICQRVERLCRQSPEQAARVIRYLLQRSVSGRSPRHYSSAAQAAMILLSLNKITGRNVLRFLSAREVKQLGRVIERLGAVPAADIRLALERFIHCFRVPVAVYGTDGSAKSFLTDMRPDGPQLYSEIKLTDTHQTIWDKIGQLDLGTLLNYLKKQKPETNALILCYLPETLSGRILTLLPAEISARILVHMTHLRRLKPETLDKMTGDIALTLYEVLAEQKEVSGQAKIASIMKTLSLKEKQHLMASVAQTEKTAAQTMRVLLRGWGDLLRLSDTAIRKLLVYCDRETVAEALADSSEDTWTIFARNMPMQTWREIKDLMATADVREKEKAQGVLVKTANALDLFG